MGFKEWPAWLKGGVISLGLVLLSFILFFVFGILNLLTLSNVFGSLSTFLYEFSYSLSEGLGRMLGFELCGIDGQSCTPTKIAPLFEIVLPWIFFIFGGFLIGAFIGWLVGKIKSK